ncbi:MAG: aspartyl protease family protein [Phycisphaerales bacterium]|nr:aspartyl protease family protein [Phycisphaerales bacterium]
MTHPALLIRCASILLIAGLAAAPAPGQTVDEVLTKVRAATGYEAFAAKPQGLQLKGAGTLAGNDVTFSLLVDPAGRFIQSIDGPVSITAAYDGVTAWSKDLGGEVRTLELGDRAQTALMGAILSGRWLGPDAPLDLTVDAANSTDASLRLSFTADSGIETGHVDIDRATWLPTQWTFSGSNAEQSLTYSGTISHAGITFPAKIIRGSKNGTEVMLEVASIADAPTFIRSPYARPSAAADARFDASLPAAIEVKKAPTGHLLVHPTVNGKDVGWFIFDTGAGANVLTNRVADELGLATIGRIPAIGVGGAIESRLVRPDSLVLGPMTMDRPMAVVMDLSFLDQYMGTPVAGIVGYGLLSRAVLDIDMVAPALSLYDPAHPDPAITGWHKLYIYERVPCVEARFEDHEGIFKLDTGAGKSTVSFHVPAVEKFKLLENRETAPTVQGGVGGMVAAKTGELAWFEIAGQRHEKVKVTFSTEAKGALADAYTTGNLGGGFLSDYRLIMDYQNGRIAYIKREAAATK